MTATHRHTDIQTDKKTDRQTQVPYMVTVVMVNVVE